MPGAVAELPPTHSRESTLGQHHSAHHAALVIMGWVLAHVAQRLVAESRGYIQLILACILRIALPLHPQRVARLCLCKAMYLMLSTLSPPMPTVSLAERNAFFLVERNTVFPAEHNTASPQLPQSPWQSGTVLLAMRITVFPPMFTICPAERNTASPPKCPQSPQQRPTDAPCASAPRCPPPASPQVRGLGLSLR